MDQNARKKPENQERLRKAANEIAGAIKDPVTQKQLAESAKSVSSELARTLGKRVGSIKEAINILREPKKPE
jgi:gas vesicle protein